MPEPVPSPCNRICRLSPYTGLCVGCWRTGNEIACWITTSEEGKQEVWARIAERRAAAEREAQHGFNDHLTEREPN